MIAVVGVVVSVVLLASGTASEAALQEPRLITVSGNAEVRVVPDEVILTLGVETWDKDLEMAKAENDRRVERILALAEEHEIEAEHVQTDHVSIEPRYDDGYEKRGFIGYFVRKTIVVTLRDVAKFEDLLTDVLATGATHVHGIQFQTTELRRYKDQARALAIKAAQEKAVAMSDGLGQKIGQPHSIHEDQTGWWSWYGGWWGARWGGSMAQNVVQNVGGSTFAADSSLAPGQIAVNARVTVSFELQ
jgi:uncharacterized protein YggE